VSAAERDRRRHPGLVCERSTLPSEPPRRSRLDFNRRSRNEARSLRVQQSIYNFKSTSAGEDLSIGTG